MATLPALSRLRDLLDTLESQGEVDSTGGFSLDADKARDKLRQYRLADPYWYVLLLVQSAVARGASMIEVETDGKSSLRLRFFADPLGARAIRERGSALFVSNHVQREVGALQDLAIGIDAALGLQPSVVELRSGPVTATFRPGRDDVVEGPEEVGATGEGEAEANGSEGREMDRLNTITIRHGGFLGFGPDQVAPALELLRSRARYSRTRIAIDGDNVTRGLELPPGSAPRHRFYLPHTAGVMTLSMGGAGPDVDGPDVGTARMRVLRHGVWLTDHEVALPAGIDVIVDCGVLRKDVSQQDVNRDDIYQALVEDLVDEASRFAAQLLEAIPELDGPSREAAEAWLRTAVPAVLPRPVTVHTGDRRAEHRALMGAALWPTTVKGEVLSLRDLLRNEGPLYHGHAGELIEGATVLRLREQDAVPLGAALDRDLPSARAHAAIQERKARARQRFETRWHPPTLPDAPWRVRGKIEARGFTGEIGLHRTRTEERVAFIKDGRLLVERPVHLGIPGLVVMIEGDFTPSEGYDGVVADEVLAEALAAILAAVHKLMAAHVTGLVERLDSDGSRPDLEHDVLLAYGDLLADGQHAAAFALAHGVRQQGAMARFEARVPDAGPWLPAGAFQAVPLFMDTQGGKYAIEDLRALEHAPLRNDALECVAPDTQVPPGAGPYLRLDPRGARILLVQPGVPKVRFMDGSVQRDRARQAFEARVAVSVLDRHLADPWLALSRHHAEGPWQGRVAVPFKHDRSGLEGVAILESRRVSKPTLAGYVSVGEPPSGAAHGRRIHDEPLPVGPPGLVVAIAGVEATPGYDGITNLARHGLWRAAEYGVMRLLEEIADAAPNRFRQEIGLVELLTWLHKPEHTATRAQSLLARLAGDRDVVIELEELDVEEITEAQPPGLIDLETIEPLTFEDEEETSPAILELEAELIEINQLRAEDREAEALAEAEADLVPAPVYEEGHPLTVLLEAVRGQLRAARRHNGQVLAESMLDRLGTIVSTGEKPLRIDRHHVLFDGAHPMLREAVKRVDDPATVGVMTSMAFSALVRVRPDSLEVHEEVFHTVHARVLLGAGRSGP